MLKTIFIGGLARACSPNRVEMAAITAPHQPPNKREVAMCMINDVDPRAASLNWVLSVSSKVATRRNVTNGHQPGKGKRVGQTPVAEANAARVTAMTNSLRRVCRGIELGMGIPAPSICYCQVVPSPLLKRAAKKNVTALSKLLTSMSVTSLRD